MFQSTPPTRAATGWRQDDGRGVCVSIHAAHEGGDDTSRARRGRCMRFNPRRPRGRRLGAGRRAGQAESFNPRRPRGRRRPGSAGASTYGHGFNPRRPRGRRPDIIGDPKVVTWFQSTPPTRAATVGADAHTAAKGFQSTPPTRAATRRSAVIGARKPVSIHAAHEGGDAESTVTATATWCFNPRRPRGRRRVFARATGGRTRFQSTPPTRAATRGPGR